MLSKTGAGAARIGICALVLGLAGTGANAQSSSNCIVMAGGLVHCDTMDMSQPRYDSGAELGRGLRRLIDRNRESALRKQIGEMLASGDCQGAAQLAYRKGRLELGQSIARSCGPGGAR